MNNLPPFETFYKENLGLVHKVAQKIFRRAHAMHAPLEYQDVFQECSLVMLRAHSRFDESTGFKFSTYYMQACYHEMNNKLRRHEQDINVLEITSMTGFDEDGESVSFEETVAGVEGSPEQYLEAKQTLQEARATLSPLADKLLEVLTNPPVQMQHEWNIKREMGYGNGNDMTQDFAREYLRRVGGFAHSDLVAATAELSALRKQMQV